MYFKEMNYQLRLQQPELLAADSYRGITYYVISWGSHPCAYINVAHTKYKNMSYSEMNKLGVNCHGGFTYSESKMPVSDVEGWYLGWDYAHPNDYIHYFGCDASSNYKRWTTKELERECEKVIDSIIAAIDAETTIMAMRQHLDEERDCKGCPYINCDECVDRLLTDVLEMVLKMREDK